MRNLSEVRAWSEEGDLNVVVESPRGSTVNLKYRPGVGDFTLSRALPIGLAYPFDWGFIPGTLAEDGDPVDALVLHQAATYPGIVLPCRLLGMALAERNVIIAVPVWHDPIGSLRDATTLTPELCREIGQFLKSTVFPVSSWQGYRAAKKFIEDHQTKEPTMATTHKKDAKHAKRKLRLPEPGKKKKNPRELDKLLDEGLEESMKASDPPAVTQPEVHTEPDRDAESVETGKRPPQRSSA